MTIVLFLIYFILAGRFILGNRFISETGLSKKNIAWLFVIKILAGITLGLVNHDVLNGHTDYDTYNITGIAEHKILVSDPALFFKDLFTSHYSSTGEYFGSQNSYWNDLRANIIIKALAVLNIFSRGDYYINSLFFNTFVFFGHVALYKVFIHLFPSKRIACIIGCFLLPSTLIFTSGIHKDGIIFTAIAAVIYCLYFSMEYRFTVRKTVMLILSFITILVIRNFIAVVLLPCLLVWFISRRYAFKHLLLIYTSCAVAAVLAFLFLHQTFTTADPFTVISNKQVSFLALGHANTDYRDLKLITSEPYSFLQAFPSAVRHAYMSPLPGEFKGPFIHFFTVELLIYILAFAFMFMYFKNNTLENGKYFLYFSIFFSLVILLFTGFTITNAGSLIRYRAVYLPFLITPLLCGIRLKRNNINI